MSLILDALNRSRQDSDQIPGLASQHYDEPEDEQVQWRRYLPWLALLAALLVIGWLLLERESGPDEGTVAAVLSRAPDVAVATPAPAKPQPIPRQTEIAQPAPAPAQKTSVEPQPLAQAGQDSVVESVDVPPATAPDSTVADLYQKSADPATAPPALAVKKTVEPEPAIPTEVTKAVDVPEPAPLQEVAQEQPIDIEKMVLKARDEMENARLEEHSAPFIAALSQQVKDGIPTIFYERHDYSGTPAQSSVTLNGKKVKAGGSVGSRVKVDEILPDSVVLTHQGTQFRLRALNSWVNL